MALAILDGNQTATTLSTVVTSGQHITAHTIVSLGTQAITEITGAVSGSVVTIPNLNVLARSVATEGIVDGTLNFVKIGGHQDGSNQTAHIVHVSGGGAMKVDASDSTVTFGAIRGTVTIGNSVTIGSLPAITGTVTANIGYAGRYDNGGDQITIDLAAVRGQDSALFLREGGGNVPISGTVTVGNSVTIGSLPAISGTVTANVFGLDSINLTNAKIPVIAYDEAIANAAVSYVVPVQISNNEGTIGSANPLPISGTVTANTFAVQGTAVTTSNFTSTTASTVLANYNATREVLTIFNEGAGNLHIAPGATCTTIAYQVRLSAGDYYEVPNHQTTITHSAVFATAGTARVTQVS
jgi:hypothetical protein